MYIFKGKDHGGHLQWCVRGSVDAEIVMFQKFSRMAHNAMAVHEGGLAKLLEFRPKEI
jgi:hypothetical protein